MTPLKNIYAIAIAIVVTMAVSSSFKQATAQQKTSVTPLLVRNIDEPGFNAYQVSQAVNFSQFGFVASLPIPTGKIAVVEHVSVSGTAQSGGMLRASINCFNGSEDVTHSLVLTPQGDFSGSTAYAASQPLKCYATPGSTNLSINVQSTTLNNGSRQWIVAASGYVLPQ